MRHWVGIELAIGLTMAAPCDPLAQTARTAAADAAFARGDYARAVEMLKPAAESWQIPFDSSAAFLMALMYDNGLGVAQDPAGTRD
jgi:TPR repeat protein